MGACLAVSAAAQVFPAYLNYQGKLGDNTGNPLTGTYSFRFKLYSQGAGGSPLLTDANYTGSNAVSVVNGVYAVQIGSLTAGGIPTSIFFNSEVWLEIDVAAGASLTSAETLSPRERLTTAPFAFLASNAQSLGTTSTASFTASGNLQAPYGVLAGSFTATSFVTASAFFGDGSHLTGLVSTGSVILSGASAGGVLSGAYPNPTFGSSIVLSSHIANGAIGDAKVALSTAAIAAGKFGDTQVAISTGALGASVVQVANGGTGASSASGARSNLGAAASGANADISSLAGAGSGVAFSTNVIATSSLTVSGNAFSVGGSTFVVNGGNVGVGTTNPSLVTAGSTALEVGVNGDFFPSLGVSRTGGITKTNRVWQMTVTSPGGVSLRDANTGNNPFMIEAGSPNGALYMASTGNVGVGTTSPAAKLHMSSGTLLIDGTNPAFVVSGGSVTASAFFGDGSRLTGVPSTGSIAGVYVQKAGDGMTGPLTMLSGSTLTVTGNAFSVGGSTLVVNGGNVGIGTTNPGVPLDVKFNPGADSSVANFTNTNALGGATLAIYRSNGAIGGPRAAQVSFNDQWYAGIVRNAGSGTDAFSISSNSDRSVGGGELMISGGSVYAKNGLGVGYSTLGSAMLAVNGSVGIGTASPGAALDVYGGNVRISTAAASVTGDYVFQTGANGQMVMIGNAANYVLDVANKSDIWGGRFRAGSGQTAGSVLEADNAAASSTYFIVKPSGSVGIGTSSPAAKLHLSSGAVLVDGINTALTVSGGSVTASAFFGDGSHLTGIPSTSSIAGVYVQKAGDVMTGPLTLSGSTLTVTGNAFSVSSPTFVITGGNVGVGTPTPLSRLDMTGVLRLDNGTTQGNYFATLNANYNSVHPFSIGVENNTGGTASEIMGVYSPSGGGSLNLALGLTGNVGISTGSPVTTLDVNGAAQFGGGLFKSTFSSTGDPSFRGPIIAGGAAPGDTYGNLSLVNTSGITTDFLGSFTGQASYINNGGNFGIGTANPATTFDVNGNSQFGSGTTKSTFTAAGALLTSSGTFTVYNNATAIGTLTNANLVLAGAGVTNSSNWMSLGYAGGAFSPAYMGFTATTGAGFTQGDLVFGTRGATTDSSATERMRITSGGNIGIGMTSPATKLHVSSGILTVDGSGGGLAVSGGSVTASAFFGDGSHLTGLSGTLTGGLANVVPVWTGATSLGVGSGYITNYSTGVAIQTNAFSVGVSTLVVSGGNVGVGTANFTYGGQLTVKNANSQNNFISGETSDFSPASAGTQLLLGFGAASGNTYGVVNTLSGGGVAWNNLVLQSGGGNVGIGTTSPGQKLAVQGANNAYNLTVSSDNANGFGVYIGNSGSFVGSVLTTMNNQPLGLSTNQGAGTLIVNGSNIGIGITSPDVPLHVDGSNGLPANSGTTPTGYLELRDKRNTASHGLFMGVMSAAPWGSWLQAQDMNNLATDYPIALNPNGGNVGIGAASPAATLHVSSAASSGSTLLMEISSGTAAGQQLMVVQANGNVGIGTTSPTRRLTVSGGGNIIIDNAAAYMVHNTLGAEVSALYSGPDDYNWMYSIRSGYGMKFGGYAGTALMTIQDSGNVGIGTANPAAKLHMSSGTLLMDGANPALAVSGGSVTASAFFGDGSHLTGVASASNFVQKAGDTMSGQLTIYGSSLTLRSNAASSPLYVSTSPTAGVVGLYVDANNNVGLGTASPAALLHVKGGALKNELAGGQLIPAFVTGDGSRVLLEAQNAYDTAIFGAETSAGVTWAGSLTGATLIGTQGNHPAQMGTNSTVGLTMTSAQQVGIGTTSPGATLHVSSAATSGTTLLMEISSGTGAGQQLMVVQANGSVGIGTTSPTTIFNRTLQVSNIGTNSNSAVVIEGNSTVTNNDIGHLSFFNNASRQAEIIATNDGGATTSRLDFYTSNAGSVNVDAMTIKGGGNVGIGTATPSAFFHVYKSGAAQPMARIEDPAASSNPALSIKNGNGQDFLLQTVGLRNNNFEVWDQNNAATRLAIATSGNVGIGTSNPAAKLHLSSGAVLIDGTGAGLTISGGSVQLSNNQQLIWLNPNNQATGVMGLDTSSNVYVRNPMTGGSIKIGADTTPNILLAQTGGNVGVGTAGPGARLELFANSADTTGSDALISEPHSAGNGDLRMGVTTGHLSFLQAHLWSTGYSSLAINPNGGNVGIGTTSPASKLHLSSGALTIDGTSPAISVAGGSVTASAFFGDGSHLSGIPSTSSIAGVYVQKAGDAMSGQLTIYGSSLTIRSNAAASPLLVSTTSTPGVVGLFVDPTDRVGIGTAGPSAALEVAGSGTTLKVSNSTSGSEALVLKATVNTMSTLNALDLWDAGDTGTSGVSFNNINHTAHTSDIAFNTRTFGTPMIIKDSGNVGIGTTTPGVRLDVLAPSGVDQTAQFQGNNASGGYVNFYDAANSANRGFIGYGGTLFTGLANSNFGLRSQGGLVLASNGGFIREYIDVNGNVGVATSAPAGLFTVGNGTMTVLASGNVGIGTSSPGALFNLNFSDNGGLKTYTNGQFEGLGINTYWDSTNAFLRTTDFVGGRASNAVNGGSQFRFFVQPQSLGNPTEAVHISSTGAVGIGTTSPAGTLHVKGGNDNDLIVDNGGQQYTDLYLDNNGTKKAAFQWDNSNQYAVLETLVSGTTMQIDSTGGGSVQLAPNGVVALQAQSGTGNVGIGTTSPLVNLNAFNGSSANPSNDANPVANGTFRYDQASEGITFGAYASGTVWMQGQNRNVSGTHRSIAINPDGGNVGIGTTGPAAKLDVNGIVDVGGYPVLTPTFFGYSSGYHVTMLGAGSGTQSIAIGYDPSVNVNAGFTGDGREILFRRGAQFVTPNAANNNWNLFNLVLLDGNVGIGTSLPATSLDVNGNAQFGSGATKSTFTAAGNLNVPGVTCSNSTCLGGGTGFTGVGSVATTGSLIGATDMNGNAKPLGGLSLLLDSAYSAPNEKLYANGALVSANQAGNWNNYSGLFLDYLVAGSQGRLSVGRNGGAGGANSLSVNLWNGSAYVAPLTIYPSSVSISNGYLNVLNSSVTASAFFGDGSHLTGVGGSLTGGIASVVPVWTGPTTLGIGNGYITNYSTGVAIQANAFSVGVTAFVVNGGNVGLGTSNPATKLHVSSGVVTIDGAGSGLVTGSISSTATLTIASANGSSGGAPLIMTAGNGTAGNASGGDFTVSAGNGNNGQGGQFLLSAGNTSSWSPTVGSHSDVTINGGNTDATTRAFLVIGGGVTAAAAGPAEANGGTITLTGGNANTGTGASRNGGNINLLPGAATASGTPGRVGIGTNAPAAALHVSSPTSGTTLLLEVSSGTGTGQQLLVVQANGNVGIGTASPTNPLQMGSGALVTAGGVWTNASSRAFKRDIAELPLDKALETLRGLDPVTFRYKKEPEQTHVGFIAEDVPDLVATKDRRGLSAMDIIAVLTKVVQAQQREIESLKARGR